MFVNTYAGEWNAKAIADAYSDVASEVGGETFRC
jgi:hypothetical protein